MSTIKKFGVPFLAIIAMLMGASASMAQNKMWAKFDNGILTFTYGAKPRIVQSPVKCSECGKMLAAADKYCSNCGTAKPASMTDVFEVPQNIENNVIPWQVHSKEVKKVVFTLSCKRYSDTQTSFSYPPIQTD